MWSEWGFVWPVRPFKTWWCCAGLTNFLVYLHSSTKERGRSCKSNVWFERRSCRWSATLFRIDIGQTLSAHQPVIIEPEYSKCVTREWPVCHRCTWESTSIRLRKQLLVNDTADCIWLAEEVDMGSRFCSSYIMEASTLMTSYCLTNPDSAVKNKHTNEKFVGIDVRGE